MKAITVLFAALALTACARSSSTTPGTVREASAATLHPAETSITVIQLDPRGVAGNPVDPDWPGFTEVFETRDCSQLSEETQLSRSARYSYLDKNPDGWERYRKTVTAKTCTY
jgi:hypothetical protein